MHKVTDTAAVCISLRQVVQPLPAIPTPFIIRELLHAGWRSKHI